MANIELPKDAEGREIPLDTTSIFGVSGKAYNIVRWEYITGFDEGNQTAHEWYGITEFLSVLEPEKLLLIPPDSWEKLEKDLGRGADALNYEACAYFGKSACDCSSCIADKGETCERVVMRDIADRIHKLRGES